ncbi:MAG: helix-turn-helix transcriptional regulator [Bdellovibrionota bacterium]|jgi:transcriptional regulator with XRE-family HTH domain|nr:helix-turn-helix transcriptional regulator [Bdellovibrionota bacterium]
MAQFHKDKVSLFLGAVRKYMEIRGPMTQRELAEATDTGVSTMSRFLNQQTQELNPNLIAKITAILNIPPMEIIDFVEEDYSSEFLRLVRFYKGEDAGQTRTSVGQPEASSQVETEEEEQIAQALEAGGSQRTTSANIRVGNKTTRMNYVAEGDSQLREKLQRLSLKQKGFLNGFLNLDSDGRDLVADVGEKIITYLKQKGIDF